MDASDPGRTAAVKPPPGVTPNFVNPPSQGYLVILTVTVSLTASTLLVLPRVYMSFFVSKRFGWDDVTCAMAWVGLIGYSVIYINLIPNGAFTDQWNLYLTTVVRWAQLTADAEIVYSILVFLTKLSILLLYIKLFLPNKTRHSLAYWAIHSLIWFNVLFYTANTFGEIFYCIPRTKIWLPDTPGHCVNVYILIISSAAINAFSDLMMIIIPICIIWRLNMPGNRKLGISIVFTFGTFSMVCGLIRVYIGVTGAGDPNQTVVLMKIAMWAYGEISAGLITSCMPAMPQFFRHVFPHMFSSSNDNALFATYTDAQGRSKRKSGKTSVRKGNIMNSFIARRKMYGQDGKMRFEDPYLLPSYIEEEANDPTNLSIPNTVASASTGYSDLDSNGQTQQSPEGGGIMVTRMYDVSTSERPLELSEIRPAHMAPEK